jgi:hypothetical protein
MEHKSVTLLFVQLFHESYISGKNRFTIKPMCFIVVQKKKSIKRLGRELQLRDSPFVFELISKRCK